MSGSGGTVYDPEPPRSPCERLSFNTILNSPNPGVVPLLRAGALLDIVAEPRSDGLIIVVARHGNAIAGAITSDQLLQLIECLKGGHRFVADVLSVKTSRVDVLVRHE
jgi:hypothetical protein